MDAFLQAYVEGQADLSVSMALDSTDNVNKAWSKLLATVPIATIDFAIGTQTHETLVPQFRFVRV